MPLKSLPSHATEGKLALLAHRAIQGFFALRSGGKSPPAATYLPAGFRWIVSTKERNQNLKSNPMFFAGQDRLGG